MVLEKLLPRWHPERMKKFHRKRLKVEKKIAKIEVKIGNMELEIRRCLGILRRYDPKRYDLAPTYRYLEKLKENYKELLRQKEELKAQYDKIQP